MICLFQSLSRQLRFRPCRLQELKKSNTWYSFHQHNRRSWRNSVPFSLNFFLRIVRGAQLGNCGSRIYNKKRQIHQEERNMRDTLVMMYSIRPQMFLCRGQFRQNMSVDSPHNVEDSYPYDMKCEKGRAKNPLQHHIIINN